MTRTTQDAWRANFDPRADLAEQFVRGAVTV
jgi:hypothetical protein